MAGRSLATVRRWIRDGTLESAKGPRPARGGGAPTYVSRAAVHALLASGAVAPEPIPGGAAHVSTPLDAARHRARAEDLAAEVERLRAALGAAEAAAERWREQAERERADRLDLVADLRGQRDAAQAEVAGLRAELATLRTGRRLPSVRGLLREVAGIVRGDHEGTP